MKFKAFSFASFLLFEQFQALIIPDEIPARSHLLTQAHLSDISSPPGSSRIDGTSLMVSLDKNKVGGGLNYQKDGFQKDTIVRILDGNTIRLQKSGLVSIAGAQYPTTSSNFRFSECSTYGPTYKLRQLIPAKTGVWVKIISGNKPQAVIFRQEDSLNVNQELVKSGFAKAKPSLVVSDFETYLDLSKLKSWEAEANQKGLGIFKQCDDANPESSSFVAEFEPLDFDVETQWGDDGGKRVMIKPKETVALEPPSNPGDIKGCSDFETYEDALSWFEYYKPFYGDIAKLDRNGDGVPCPGLPHTSVRERYRMKKPQSQQDSSMLAADGEKNRS